MISNEEYLDSLLKAALNGEQHTEQNTADVLAEDKLEEALPMEEEPVLENSNDSVRDLSADEIAELFAQTEEKESIAEEEDEISPAQETDEMATLFEQAEGNEGEAEEPEEVAEEVTDEMAALSGQAEGNEGEAEEPEEATEEVTDEMATLFEQAEGNEGETEEPEEAAEEVTDEMAALSGQAEGNEEPAKISEENSEEQQETEKQQNLGEQTEESKGQEEDISIESLLAQESLGEPLEIDLKDDSDLDMLLGIREKSDTDESEEADFDNLLESLAGENEDLQEIGELLQKLDNNELVSDNLEPGSDTKSEGTGKNSEEQEEIRKSKKDRKEKKEKKGFSFFKKKENLRKEEINEGAKEAGTEEKIEERTAGSEELLPEELVNELGLEGLDSEAVTELLMGENEREGASEETAPKEKKKSFWSKVFDVLTEEIPEEQQDSDKETDTETGGKNGRKGRKGKKGKRAPVTDASDNEGILEELDAEQAESKKVKGKKKAGKPRTEKAGKEKKKKEAAASDSNEKKLPFKMVVRVFALCFSVMVLVLVVTYFVPGIWSLADARNAFYKQDYEKAYTEMTGRDLSDSDQRLYEKSKMILQLSHKYEAYENYKKMGMSVRALDALLSGYTLWQQLGEKIAEYDAVTETDAVKVQILDALQADYQISEEDAQILNSLDNYTYTSELEKITGSSSQAKVQSDSNSETGAETEKPQAPAEDVLSEEEVK